MGAANDYTHLCLDGEEVNDIIRVGSGMCGCLSRGGGPHGAINIHTPIIHTTDF